MAEVEWRKNTFELGRKFRSVASMPVVFFQQREVGEPSWIPSGRIISRAMLWYANEYPNHRERVSVCSDSRKCGWLTDAMSNRRDDRSNTKVRVRREKADVTDSNKE